MPFANVIVNFPESAFGADEIEKIEVCVEPHRVILVLPKSCDTSARLV